MAKLDIRIVESGKESLVIELGGRSRLLYFFIFLFLSTAVFFSIDFSYDFSPSRIGGTLFTFLLILISLGVTVTIRSFRIDKSSGVLAKTVGLPFGIFSKNLKRYRLGGKPQFVIRPASPALPREDTGLNRFSRTAGTMMAGSRVKISLCLETEEDSVTLCEGTSKEEVSQAASFMSAYLGIPVKTG